MFEKKHNKTIEDFNLVGASAGMHKVQQFAVEYKKGFNSSTIIIKDYVNSKKAEEVAEAAPVEEKTAKAKKTAPAKLTNLEITVSNEKTLKQLQNIVVAATGKKQKSKKETKNKKASRMFKYRHETI